MKRILNIAMLLVLPLISFSQLSEALDRMKSDSEPDFEEYQVFVFNASNNVLSGPMTRKSDEFKASIQIVSFWMNRDTGMGIPTFGGFHSSLASSRDQKFLYVVAMMHYSLDQKINHQRILKCEPIDGQKYNEQDDVREVQLNGAKILLKYLLDSNMAMSSKTKKYYKAYKKDELEKVFFQL